MTCEPPMTRQKFFFGGFCPQLPRRCQLMWLGRHSVANPDMTLVTLSEPQWGQDGSAPVDCQSHSSKRPSHFSHWYS